MEVRIVAVGRVKERGVRETIDDYLERISHYAKVREIELSDGNENEVTARIKKAIPERARVVAMEVEGDVLTSAGLAKLVGRAENDAIGSLVFLIGGSYGLPPDVSRAAHSRISLSAMTLPHRLARLVLAEQIYRGFSILRGSPYDH